MSHGYVNAPRSNRFHDAAERISREYGVFVEWAECNREYVVNCRLAGRSARDAEKMARDLARDRDLAAEAERQSDEER